MVFCQLASDVDLVEEVELRRLESGVPVFLNSADPKLDGTRLPDKRQCEDLVMQNRWGPDTG